MDDTDAPVTPKSVLDQLKDWKELIANASGRLESTEAAGVQCPLFGRLRRVVSERRVHRDIM